MTLGLWALAIVLSSGQVPPAVPAPAAEAAETDQALPQVSGERGSFDAATQTYRLRGNTRLSFGDTQVRADELLYDQLSGTAVASGNVVVVSGNLATFADELRLDVARAELDIRSGVLMEKSGATPEELLGVKSAEELAAIGETVSLVRGRRLRRLGPRRFEVDGVAFTPCDCRKDAPSWSLRASSADVELNERAILWWPVVYLGKVPLLVSPWMYVPLADRRTGFLFPRPTVTPLSGKGIEQAFFWAISRSYDLTLTPRYVSGPEGTPPEGSIQRDRGIKGPGLETEFRYTPSAQMSGGFTLNTFYDLLLERDPVTPSIVLGSKRGLRAAITGRHSQALGAGWNARANVNAVSDGYQVKDTEQDILVRERQYLRSTAALSRGVGDYYAGVDVGILQDTRWGFAYFEPNRDAAGNLVRGPNTPQRLPALSLSVMPQLWGGRLLTSLDTQLIRWAPLNGRSGDEGLDGRYDPLAPDPDGSQSDRRVQTAQGDKPGERAPYVRLDLNPRLSLPIQLGRFALLTPYAALRQDTYLYEHSGQWATRAYPIAGVQLENELSRTFSLREGALRHTISPMAAVQYIPRPWGAAPANAMDEIDLAVPARGAFEAVVQVRQSLIRRTGNRAVQALRFDLGQGFDLRNRKPLDSFARLGLQLWRLELNAVGRWDPVRKVVSHFASGLRLQLPRAIEAWADYETIVEGGSDRLRRPTDLLVGTLADPNALRPAPAQIVCGLQGTFFNLLTARYIARIAPLAVPPQSVLVQQTAALGLAPACNCWRLELAATFFAKDSPALGLNFNITGFGSGGTSF